MNKPVTKVIEVQSLQEGVFIPKTLFGEAKELEIVFSDDKSVTIRPRRQSRVNLRQRIDARREMLRARFGQMSDSSTLIRQFRDER